MSRRIPIGIKTSPQAVDWSTLDATWQRIGAHDVFESVWMNDHLIDVAHDRHGASFESMTAMATLAHHVPGRWLGAAVLAATFRHPAVLAKAATVMDHATGGRYIVGLGAGWHDGEHLPFGIRMPQMPERFDRFESSVHVLRALWSDAARTPPGVTRPDPFYPLTDATNEPPTLTPGGPRLWLGGQKRRGIALAAAVADGWVQPAVAVGEGRPTTLEDFSDRHAALVRALEEVGRDPDTFEFGAQVPTGTTDDDRRHALDQAHEAAERGATHVILALRPSLGPDGVDAVARQVAEPLRRALG
ncbi:MAG TPA: LLM class flavin-dependent oxidoreductase [Candidatus Limnocylindrales bacterium]|nr:LLM class flavin-dependent oxidoreductase [Candidatus Limnocylindrales bacterium]